MKYRVLQTKKYHFNFDTCIFHLIFIYATIFLYFSLMHLIYFIFKIIFLLVR